MTPRVYSPHTYGPNDSRYCKVCKCIMPFSNNECDYCKKSVIGH